jgi:hypothetical protein
MANDTTKYERIETEKLDKMSERLSINIGKCDQMASGDIKDENYKQAYEKLREEIDIFLDELNENKQLSFERE